MEGVLEKELQVYEAHRSELLHKASNKFVLIKGDEVVGIYDAEMDAMREGYQRFGNVPFLVKQIVEVEIPLSFTSGLIRI